MEQQELGTTEETTTAAELSGLETAASETAGNETAAADAPAPETTDSSATKEINGLKRGALVEGTITSTSPTLITLDLGEGREGIISSAELERMDVKRLQDFVVGAVIRVKVINPRSKDGKAVVSYDNALEESDWQKASEYAASKEVFHGKIGGYNKGGLIVRFGRVRGFIPQSQISEARLRRLSGETPEQRYGQLINENISVKVMEVDRERNRLILSERAAEREVRQYKKQSLIAELQVGDERTGTVVSLETFGAFVDIGGAEGLVHLTELSHHHITHPRQAVSVGEQVRVKVIGIDPENNRIALSVKELLADPWDEIAVRYAPGTLVRGTITKTAKFGAFARIEGADNIEGLIHISELSDERVEDPKEVVKKGDLLTLRVLRVDIAEKRLGLSLRKVFSTEYLDQDLQAAFENPALMEIPERAQASRMREKLEEAREKGAEIIEGLKVKSAEAGDELREKLEEAREKGAEIIEDLKEKASAAGEDLKEKSAEAGDELREKLEEAREKGAEIIEDLKEKASAAGEDLKEKLGEAREKGAEIVEGLKAKLSREDNSEVAE
jgi:small subunit ribosomal protein S1